MDNERFPDKEAVEDHKENLTGANLTRADLSRADLTDAIGLEHD